MKKLIALLLCFVMVLGMFAGCKKAEDAPVTDTPTKPAADTSKGEDEKVEEETLPEYVHIPIVFFGAPGSRNVEFFENELNERLKEELNITIEVSYIDWGGYDKLEAMLASGEEFIFMNYGSQVARFAQKGLMAEITEEQIAAVAPNLVAARMGLDYETCKYKGVNYVIPVGSQVFSAPMENINVRNDLLNAVGLDYTDIKTYEDLTNAYLKVREKFPDIKFGNPGMFACNPEEGDPIVFKQGDLYGIFTDHADADSDQLFASYTSDIYKKYLEQMYEWKAMGFFDDEEWITYGGNYENVIWANGSAFCVHGTPVAMIDHTLQGVEGADVQYLEIENNQHIIAYNYDWGWSASVEGSKYIEPMLRLLNWLYASEENYTFITRGIEGKDWEYAEDGETITPLVADEFFYDWQHKTLMFIDETQYDPDDWARYTSFNDKAIPSKVLGYAADLAPIEVEFAAMKAVVNEYSNWLLYDSYEEWAETFLPKLEEAGYQTFIDEIQRQFSAWWAETH